MKKGTGNRLQYQYTAQGPEQFPLAGDVLDAWRHHTALLFDWYSVFFLESGLSETEFRRKCVASGIPVADSTVPKPHQHFHGYGYCLHAVGLDAEVLSDEQMYCALKGLMTMLQDPTGQIMPARLASILVAPLKMWADLTDETIFATKQV